MRTMTDAAPVRYRAVAAGVIRTDAALDSAKATPENLTVGQELLVTEVREVEGTVRLKFDGGCKCVARVFFVCSYCCAAASLTSPLCAAVIRDVADGQERQNFGREARCFRRRLGL